MKILMVCIGNICRSPIAEGIMQHLMDKNQLNWEVSSAAIADYHIGSAPHPSSQKVCKEHGIDISKQRSRLFKKEDLEYFDKIYAMEDSVLEVIRKKAGKQFDPKKVSLFLEELHPGSNESVPDPWYGNEDGYLPVFRLIEQTCEKIVEHYQTKEKAHD